MVFIKKINYNTCECVLVILAEILESLTTCENALNLEDAKSKAGNDMLKVMQYVYPIVVKTQMDIIKKYGLPEGREGYFKTR